MSAEMLGLLSFPVLLVLIFLRVPIGLAMFLVGMGGNFLLRGSTVPFLSQAKDLVFATFSNHSFSIIPLFLLMGHLAAIGGLSAALFNAAQAWLGHKRGGVAMAAIGACAGFGAICGSSLATAATMGKVALPELRKHGFSGALATGTLAAGGTLGILIPPSIILVIYAVLAEQNIALLFLSAIVPGLLAVVGYVVAIQIFTRLVPSAAGRAEPVPLAQRWQALAQVWPILLIFCTVVGGIYFQFFTPTEGAAIGALGAAITAWATGGLSRQKLWQAILETANSSAMIFLIILGAAVFNSFLGFARLPQFLQSMISQNELNPWMVLAIVLAIYLVFGAMMDSLSMILLTLPIFFPIMAGLDFGLSPAEFGIWFGILVLVAVELGLITPPVGLNLFIINKMARDVPLPQTYLGVTPFVLADLVRLTLLAAFPIISLIFIA